MTDLEDKELSVLISRHLGKVNVGLVMCSSRVRIRVTAAVNMAAVLQ